jgi:predicted transcriptional regulator
MGAIDFADPTGLAIAGETNTSSETFLLRPDARPETFEKSRLERMHRLIRQHDTDLPSSSGLDAGSSGDDEDAGDEPSVLVEATTTRDGEVHSQFLFEDLKVFINSFSERHLNLLRTVRQDGPIKPPILAKHLDCDLSMALSDLRDLVSLGLIDETRRGVKVEYDELTISVRVDE